jgi:hypothetical protein
MKRVLAFCQRVCFKGIKIFRPWGEIILNGLNLQELLSVFSNFSVIVTTK